MDCIHCWQEKKASLSSGSETGRELSLEDWADIADMARTGAEAISLKLGFRNLASLFFDITYESLTTGMSFF